MHGCNPGVTVSVAATNNADGNTGNDSAQASERDDYAGAIGPGETCLDPAC